MKKYLLALTVATLIPSIGFGETVYNENPGHCLKSDANLILGNGEFWLGEAHWVRSQPLVKASGARGGMYEGFAEGEYLGQAMWAFRTVLEGNAVEVFNDQGKYLFIKCR